MVWYRPPLITNNLCVKFDWATMVVFILPPKIAKSHQEHQCFIKTLCSPSFKIVLDFAVLLSYHLIASIFQNYLLGFLFIFRIQCLHLGPTERNGQIEANRIIQNGSKRSLYFLYCPILPLNNIVYIHWF